MPRKKKPVEPITQEELLERLSAEFDQVDTVLIQTLMSDYPEPTTADERALRNALTQLRAASDRAEREEAMIEWQTDNSESSNTTGGGGGGINELETSLPQLKIDATARDDSIDSVTFVQQVFPELSPAEIEAKLQLYGGDVEKTVDEMLLEASLLSSSESDPSSASNSTASSSSSSSSAASTASSVSKPPPSRASIAKLRPGKAVTISLTSPPNLTPPPSRSSTPSSARTNMSARYAEYIDNLWVSLDSLALHLSTLLGLSAGAISSYFHSHPSSASPSTALHAFVSDLAARKPPVPLSDVEGFIELLGLEWSDERRPKAELALRACQGRVGDAMDLWQVLQDAAVEGTLMQLIPTTPGNALVRDSSTTPSLGSAVAPVPLPATKPAAPLPPLAQTTTPVLASSVLRPYSPEECAIQVERYSRRRQELFRDAARQYQRGTIEGRGAAFIRAEQGREADRMLRVWEDKRAQSWLEQRRRHDPFTVDLHGMTLRQALNIVHNSCNTWWSASTSTSPAPLRIITGVGHHSANNNPILLPAVVKQLDREGWRWKGDGPGAGKAQFGAVVVLGAK